MILQSVPKEQNVLHTSSVGRFSENVDDKVVTYTSSFSFERTDFKNLIFEKIHWAPSEVAEVAEVKRSRNSKQ